MARNFMLFDTELQKWVSDPLGAVISRLRDRRFHILQQYQRARYLDPKYTQQIADVNDAIALCVAIYNS